MRFAYGNLKSLVTNSSWRKLENCLAETMPTLKFGTADSLRVLRSLDLSIVGKSYYALNLIPPPLENKFAAQSVWISSKLERILNNPSLGWLGMAFVIAAKKSQPAASRSVKQTESAVRRSGYAARASDRIGEARGQFPRG